MKIIAVVATLVAVCAGGAIPVIPGDNSHYVEGVSRYIWMLDSEGKPTLVDLQEPVDEALLSTRNGANNQYRLFTRNNRNNPQIIVNGNANSIWNSNYHSGRPTKVIVHGLNQDGNAGMNSLIAGAFLDTQDCNVIVVDWGALANNGYTSAAAGVPSVGQFLGNFINWLFNTAGGNWNSLHLVGFSLGAHVVGVAGRQIGGRAARVTGLDPANPGWNNNPNAINRNSGQYVEGIHTDGNFFGIMTPIGDADFYPNGGKHPQPGCVLIGGNVCSHGRAPDLFGSTVRHNHLIGRQCPNIWEAELGTCSGVSFHMGNGNIGKRGSGLFALRTGNSWPF